jgi:acyl-CoA synthetase (AMP-forming)/AMP-acid ligase II
MVDGASGREISYKALAGLTRKVNTGVSWVVYERKLL